MQIYYMLWFACLTLLFLIIVLLLQPYVLVEGFKKKPNPIAKAFKSVSKTVNKNIIKPVEKNVIKPVEKNVIKPIKNIITPPKPKPKPKPMVLPVPVEFASYSDNVKPPYVGDNFQEVQNDVNEYKKALNGETSNNMVSKYPLGMLYFHNTKTKCNYNNKMVDKHIIVDSRADTDLFNSADADFNKSMQFNTPSYTMAKCVPTTIQPIDVYGRVLPKETRYV